MSLPGSALIAPPGDSPPALAFVTHTGPPSRSRDTQRLVRRHVMRQVGKSRRKGRQVPPGSWKFDLEVPDDPLWNEGSLQPSQEHLPYRSTPELLDNRLDEDKDAGRSSLTVGLPGAQIHAGTGLPPEMTRRSPNVSQTSETIGRLWVGRSDPFVRYPIRMNYRARELIDHIFDSRNTSFKPFRDVWFPVGMMDPAAFHQLLANSALSISLLRNIDKAPESYEAISHHTYAINLVNKRLGDPTFAISDRAMSAVTAFICYYNIIGDTKKWQVHMSGVKEIVRLRGGPDSPSFHSFVRLILSVADINGSCTQDLPPTFPLPTFVNQTPTYPTAMETPLLSAASASRGWQTLLPAAITAIIDDLIRLTTFLKAESARTHGRIYEDVSYASTHVNPLLHRLLRLCPPPDTAPAPAPAPAAADDPSMLQEATRLAAILYLAEIRRNFGILPATTTAQVSRLRRLLLQQSPPSGPVASSRAAAPSSPPPPLTTSQPHGGASAPFSAPPPPLLLWVLAMGVVESHGNNGGGDGVSSSAAGNDEREAATWFRERFRFEAARVRDAGEAQVGLGMRSGRDGDDDDDRVGDGDGDGNEVGDNRDDAATAATAAAPTPTTTTTDANIPDIEPLRNFLWIDDLHGAIFSRAWLSEARVGAGGGARGAVGDGVCA